MLTSLNLKGTTFNYFLKCYYRKYIHMLQIEQFNCTFVRFKKFLFDEVDFNREGGMLDDENAGRNDRL